MFGAATTLVAESVPAAFRAMALGSLQALSALGNIIGSLLSLADPAGRANFSASYAGWRVLFFVGIVPALLVVPIMFVLKEPDSWLKAKARCRAGAARENVGSPVELFRDPRWRRNTIVGLFLGVSGMIGLWGIGFFSPELISTALKGAPQNVVDTRARVGHGVSGRRLVPRHDHLYARRGVRQPPAGVSRRAAAEHGRDDVRLSVAELGRATRTGCCR